MPHSKQAADKLCPFCASFFTRSGIGRHRKACGERIRVERGEEEYRRVLLNRANRGVLSLKWEMRPHTDHAIMLMTNSPGPICNTYSRSLVRT